MENFLASLSDEQLGSFYAVQYDDDCDDKLMDILTKPQYDLYWKTKNESNVLPSTHSESVPSWDRDGFLVSGATSEAVSGTTSNSSKSINIFITIFSSVVEHLNRKKYALKNKMKTDYSVEMRAHIDRANASHTFVTLTGTSKDSLLDAQSLLWKELLPLQTQLKRIDEENIKAMWEIDWDRTEQMRFTNRTNVQLEFTAGDRTVLNGFTIKDLNEAAQLLQEYQKTGKRPSDEKQKKKTHRPVQNIPTMQKPYVNSTNNKGSKTGSYPKKASIFTMFINHPVVDIINEGNSLKNEILRKYGVNMECFQDRGDEDQTLVNLHGDFTTFYDAEYDIFLHISKHQPFTDPISHQSLIDMWSTWSKREKVLFFLETTTFVSEGTCVLKGFQHRHMMNAKNKLKEYYQSGTKPTPSNNKGNKKQDGEQTGCQNTKNLEATGSLTIELENGYEKRVGGILIGTKGVNRIAMEDLCGVKAKIVSTPGLIKIVLTAVSEENIFKAEKHICSKIRSIQNYQRDYFLSHNHAWRSYNEQQKTKFQCAEQVTVEADPQNNSKLILKAFLLSKLDLAVGQLESNRNNNKHRSRLLLRSFIKHKLDNAIAQLNSREGCLPSILSKLI